MLANALYCWALDNPERIDQLIAERDALVDALLSGGKPSTSLTAATLNGKSFTALVALSKEDKLALLTEVLTMLGEAAPLPTIVTANFRCAQR